MNKEFVEVKSFGEVFPKTTPNNRVPYEHQKKAMHNMDIINKICRNGVTIWHNHANIGNYSLNNSIV